MEDFKKNLTKGLKSIGNTLKKPVIIISIVAIVIFFICASYVAIADEFSSEVGEHMKNNPVDYHYNTDNPSDKSIKITEESIDDLIRVIEKMGIRLTDLKLTRDDIEKFYAAEVVSSEVNRVNEVNGETEENGKYYGRVYIKRLNSDTGELEALKFEPSLTTFEQMDAAQILNYFSMDGDKICIASTQTSTDNDGNTTSTVRIDKLSYKDDISQYIVPIEFLLDLCFISQNSGLALALADKIIDETEIVIQVLQDTTTIQTDTTYTYCTETENSTKYYEYDKDGKYVPPSSTNTEKPNVSDPIPSTTTQIQTSVNSSIKIQSVKNWILEVVHNYNKVISTNVNETELVELEDEVKKRHQYSYSNREINDDGSYTEIYTSTITRKINQTTQDKITTTSETYQNGTSEGVKDKVDEFIEMLKTPYSVPGSFNKIAAIDKLENGAEILFDMLQRGERTQTLEQLMRYILGIATNRDYGASEFSFAIFDIKDFTGIGGGVVSPFGTNLSREEFINLAVTYSKNNSYVTYMANYAGDFYDVCTQYNVNPALAYAHACLETGYGTSSGCQNNYNYFGYAHYNTSNSGKKYNSPKDSIEDYCKWVVDNSTPGTSAYNANVTRGEEYAVGNSKLKGTPDSNIYVLYCRYAYLGDTHISDEPNFTSPAGTEYYKEHGSNWGTGGRIYIYAMYEQGGLYKGEYATRCGHSNGSEATTVEEKADYAVYTTNQRINIAKAIFGNACFIGGSGSIVEAAYEVADHFINSGVTVHYAGNSVKEANNNGRIVIGGNIQNSWDYPIENSSKYGVVCATYVSLALWKAGIMDEATINQYGYNGCAGVKSMLTTSSYSSQWQKITSFSELQEGDIVFQPGHVYIYMDGGKCLDQNYCVISSSGNDNRGKLLTASATKFTEAYRYIGE